MNYNKFIIIGAVLALATAISQNAHADSGTITFVNTTGRALWVDFYSSKAQCIINPPGPYTYPIGIDGNRKFPLEVDPKCGDASIQFGLSQITGNSQYPSIGGTGTYRRYKGRNGQWLAKVSFAPNPGITARSFVRALCGTKPQFCLGIGIPSRDVEVVIGVLNVGLSVDFMQFRDSPGKSK
jgi:hypothetical protein